jgi:hypothetical protein
VIWLCFAVSEEFSSSGESKTEEDPEKRSARADKENRDKDREEGWTVLSMCRLLTGVVYSQFFFLMQRLCEYLTAIVL